MSFVTKCFGLIVRLSDDDFILYSGILFLGLLLVVQSNLLYLLVTMMYLIILQIKLQNIRLTFFLLFLFLLPFTKGYNFIEATLIPRELIRGYSLFDVKFYLPLYLGDVFLMIFYQQYVSNKIGSIDKIPVYLTTLYSSLCLVVLVIMVGLVSVNNVYSSLLVFSPIIILKYLLIFLSPHLGNMCTRMIHSFYGVMGAQVIFQSGLVLLEQIKGGNIGRFIESESVFGISSSESLDVLRANGTFNEPNVTATFLLMAVVTIFPYGINLLFQSRKMRQGYIYLLICFIGLVGIVFTGSRSLYGLSLFIFTAYGYIYRSYIWKMINHLWKSRKVIFVIPCIMSVMISVYLTERVSGLGDTLTEKGSMSYRFELTRYALSLYRGGLLGIGLDMTPYYLAVTYKTVDSPPVVFDQAPAHNIFIQLLIETGLVGLLVFLFFVFIVWKKTLLLENYPKGLNGFALATIVYMASAQLHPFFSNHSELTSFFFLFMGISLHLTEGYKNAEE